jgi:hypothetical protein
LKVRREKKENGNKGIHVWLGSRRLEGESTDKVGILVTKFRDLRLKVESKKIEKKETAGKCSSKRRGTEHALGPPRS